MMAYINLSEYLTLLNQAYQEMFIYRINYEISQIAGRGVKLEFQLALSHI